MERPYVPCRMQFNGVLGETKWPFRRVLRHRSNAQRPQFGLQIILRHYARQGSKRSGQWWSVSSGRRRPGN